MDFIAIGLICFIVGFIVGAWIMANSSEKQLKNGFITFGQKLYKVTEEQPKCQTNTKT